MTRLPIICGVILAMSVLSLAVGQEKERPSADLGEKLDVYVARLKHGDVKERREAVDALGRIAERAKGAAPALAEALQCEDRALRIVVAEALWQANKDPAAVA